MTWYDRRATPDDSTINFDGRHDNGAGRYTTATGGTTAARGSRATECTTFDRRHDDDKGQQGNRRHNDCDERAG